MKVLLDTHVLLWAAGGPARLPHDARALIGTGCCGDAVPVVVEDDQRVRRYLPVTAQNFRRTDVAARVMLRMQQEHRLNRADAKRARSTQ